MVLGEAFVSIFNRAALEGGVVKVQFPAQGDGTEIGVRYGAVQCPWARQKGWLWEGGIGIATFLALGL